MGSESFSGGVRAGASAEEAEVQKLDGVSSAGGIKRPFDKWTSMASRKGGVSDSISLFLQAILSI